MTNRKVKRILTSSIIKINKFSKKQKEELSVMEHWFNVGNYGLLEIGKLMNRNVLPLSKEAKDYYYGI